ncbi:MAG: hypothetical protein KDH88_19300 [Chromatiales bacterium]|nr:hypothetical protein [Chromatiales bacterium]
MKRSSKLLRAFLVAGLLAAPVGAAQAFWCPCFGWGDGFGAFDMHFGVHANAYGYGYGAPYYWGAPYYVPPVGYALPYATAPVAEESAK